MSNILDKKYYMKLSDDSTWAIPIYVIAMHHAMSHAYEKDVISHLHDKTLPLFKKHPEEIETWAKSSMTWDDVKEEAVQVFSPNTVNFKSEWLTCKVVIK